MRYHIVPHWSKFQVLDTENTLDNGNPRQVFYGNLRQCELFLAKADWDPGLAPFALAQHAASH